MVPLLTMGRAESASGRSVVPSAVGPPPLAAAGLVGHPRSRDGYRPGGARDAVSVMSGRELVSVEEYARSGGCGRNGSRPARSAGAAGA